MTRAKTDGLSAFQERFNSSQPLFEGKLVSRASSTGEKGAGVLMACFGGLRYVADWPL